MDLDRLNELTKFIEHSRTNQEDEQQLLTIEDYQQWLEWVKNRIKALDRIEEKLNQMRQLAEMAIANEFNSAHLTAANERFKELEYEVQVIDEESRQFLKMKYH